MKPSHSRLCGFCEDALIAVALDEAEAVLRQEVGAHVRRCHPCRQLFARYRSLQPLFARLRDTRACEDALQKATETLSRRLARTPAGRLRHHRFTCAAGAGCIAASERGVAVVAWQARAPQLLARLQARRDLEVQEDGETLHALAAELQAYLAGARTRLAWPIDERFMRSAFQRDVLRLTAQIPYGAVMSYQGVAEALGRPKAMRAVAQALRWNPLAIVIPCHRVIGRTGHLTGYAGGLETKRLLLRQEGIPLLARPAGVYIDTDRMYVGWRTERSYCLPQCPSLAAITPGERLLLSSRSLTAQPEFAPCDVCHPEAAGV